MKINNESALLRWLISELESLSDADPAALAQYIVALLKAKEQDDSVKDYCKDQLNDFLGQQTQGLVDSLFQVLQDGSYRNEDVADDGNDDNNEDNDNDDDDDRRTSRRNEDDEEEEEDHEEDRRGRRREDEDEDTDTQTHDDSRKRQRTDGDSSSSSSSASSSSSVGTNRTSNRGNNGGTGINQTLGGPGLGPGLGRNQGLGPGSHDPSFYDRGNRGGHGGDRGGGGGRFGGGSNNMNNFRPTNLQQSSINFQNQRGGGGMNMNIGGPVGGIFPPNLMGVDPFLHGGMEGPYFPGMMLPPGGMMLPSMGPETHMAIMGHLGGGFGGGGAHTGPHPHPPGMRGMHPSMMPGGAEFQGPGLGQRSGGPIPPGFYDQPSMGSNMHMGGYDKMGGFDNMGIPYGLPEGVGNHPPHRPPLPISAPSSSSSSSSSSSMIKPPLPKLPPTLPPEGLSTRGGLCPEVAPSVGTKGAPTGGSSTGGKAGGGASSSQLPGGGEQDSQSRDIISKVGVGGASSSGEFPKKEGDPYAQAASSYGDGVGGIRNTSMQPIPFHHPQQPPYPHQQYPHQQYPQQYPHPYSQQQQQQPYPYQQPYHKKNKKEKELPEHEKCTLKLTGVPQYVKEGELLGHFRVFGRVVELQLIITPDTTAAAGSSGAAGGEGIGSGALGGDGTTPSSSSMRVGDDPDAVIGGGGGNTGTTGKRVYNECLVQFGTCLEAKKCFNSPTAILNNRFIKMLYSTFNLVPLPDVPPPSDEEDRRQLAVVEADTVKPPKPAAAKPVGFISASKSKSSLSSPTAAATAVRLEGGSNKWVSDTVGGRGKGPNRGDGKGEGKGTASASGRSVVFAKGANKYNIADQHQIAVIQPPTTNGGKNGGGGGGKSGREVVLVEAVTTGEEEEDVNDMEMVGDGEDGEGLYEGIEEDEEEGMPLSSSSTAVVSAPVPIAPVSVPLTKEDIVLQKQYEELRVLRQQADAIWSRKEDLLQGQIDQYRVMIDKLEAASEEDPSKEALLQSIEVKIVDLQSQLRAVKDQRESGSIPQPTGVGGAAATRGGLVRGRGGRFPVPRGGGRGGRGRGGGYYPTQSYAPRGRGGRGGGRYASRGGAAASWSNSNATGGTGGESSSSMGIEES